MTTIKQLRGYYWQHNRLIGNLGDTLVPILLKALGYKLVTQAATGAQVLNPESLLLTIGSLLTEHDLGLIRGPVEVWGCGWKGMPLPPSLLARLRICAVRGPQTVAGLGLSPDTPLGDPALLLPRLTTLHRPPHNRTIVIPHFYRSRLMPVGQRCRLTGCDELISPLVIQPQGLGRRGWIIQAVGLAKSWLRLGLRPFTPWGAVERIAGAAFVLTGSLHGAILAQAYGVPWAAYEDGYVNAPPKWLDWAAYLGIRMEYVTTLAAGQQWWQSQGQRGRVRDLDTLLRAFPYPLTNE
ncbi:MAG TPA: hypothetical protein DCS43_09890 [Verrucomicrobia bacterium]|nr:hypothetical protein [Verrucomicrobiota bacterium]